VGKKISYNDISVRYTFQGAIECSCLLGFQWLHHQYMGYTKKEALKKFYDDVNNGIIK
jgi:hypothetical protein